MATQFLVYCFLGLATTSSIFLGLLVIARNNKDKLNQIFLALTLAIAGWSGTNALFAIIHDVYVKFVIALVSYGCASLLAICFYIFCLTLVINVYTENSKIRSILIGFGALNGLLATIPNIVATGVVDNTLLTHSLTLAIYGLSISALLGRTIYVWIAARTHYSLQEHKRMNVISSSFAAALIIGIVCNLLLPMRGNYEFIAIGPTGSLIFVAGTAYAIARTRLFDVHVFVLRGLGYLMTLVVIALLFVAPFIGILAYFLHAHLTSIQFFFILTLSVSLIYTLQTLRTYFDKVTSKIFFRNEYDPQEVQDKLGTVLVHTADLEIIKAGTQEILVDALKPASFRYILLIDLTYEDEILTKAFQTYYRIRRSETLSTDELNTHNDSKLIQLLRKHDIALVQKLLTNHEDIGYIVVGHKLSGQLYTERDKKLLSAAADEVAISLQNASRFEQIQRFAVTLQEEIELKTRRLQRANKRLHELDDIKDDFISMASHQLRTPLTAVKGYLSMVLDGDAGPLNGSQTQMLHQAFTSSQRMVFLITDLLNVSRLKTGKFIVDPAPLQLDALIGEEVVQLQETAALKHITVSYQAPKNFPELMLDEVKTRQVIMNFIDNAIYYTPEGGRIDVELMDLPQTVELRVTDNGIGVPRGEQHHLFTKFYRATNARRTRPDGTGLGLFMAQKVVIAQGGYIIFESEENKGSTFGFSVPKHAQLDTASALTVKA